MQVTAHLRSLRMSPRKVRLVADLVKGMDVAEADAQLTYLQKAAVTPIRKLLASAVANAEHNAKLSRANLFIRNLFVNQGPTAKRFRPRAFGRAATIRKRTSHVTIILDERVPTVASPVAPSNVPAPPVVLTERPRIVMVPASTEPTGGIAQGGTASPKRWWQSRGRRAGRVSGERTRGFLTRFLTRRTGER